MQFETGVSPIISGPGMNFNQELINDFPSNYLAAGNQQKKKSINFVDMNSQKQSKTMEEKGNLSAVNKKVKFELKVVKETKEDGGDCKEVSQKQEGTGEQVAETKPKPHKLTPVEREATIVDYLKDVEARAKRAQLPTS